MPTIYHLTRKSGNSKTGPIPVSTTSSNTCPSACALQGSGCYADAGKLGMHWRKVSTGKRGDSLASLCAGIKALPDGQIWRHNQAGDLPGTGNRINKRDLLRLSRASTGKRGFTYTHKPLTSSNLDSIREASHQGFVINLSADTMHEADEKASTGLPVVVVVPEDSPKHGTTPEGRRWAVCPAQLSDKVQCATCGLCAKAERSVIVAFRAHGASKRKAEAALSKADLERRAVVAAAVASMH